MLTLALGVIAAVISGVSLYKGGRQWLLHMDVHTTAQILEAECKHIVGSLHRCRLTYTFVLPGIGGVSNAYTGVDTVYTHEQYRVGQQVRVYYASDSPNHNSLQVTSGTIEGAGFLALSAVSGVLAAVLLMLGRRSRPRVAFR